MSIKENNVPDPISTSNIEVKLRWFDEIIRETEHYYQGEIQQDQRASWLLATSGVLVAAMVGLQTVVLDRDLRAAQFPLVISMLLFILSSITSMLTLLPLKGSRIWSDLFGTSYRHGAKLSVDSLIQERFRVGADWSYMEYEQRIKFHFRTHFLRNNRKAYGIMWSSILLGFGLLAALVTVASVVY